jgi:serine/threonine protein kinase
LQHHTTSQPLLNAKLLTAITADHDASGIPARCALAQAARSSLHDSSWCTWSARTWDERWIEATAAQLRGRGGGGDAAAIARCTMLPTSTIEEALQALDATLPPSGAAMEIPGYALGEVLGRGAKSTVFRATRADGHAVALKIIPLRGAAACARVLRALAERERVIHPRLLWPAAWGKLPGDDGIWLELELCRGSVLDKVTEADAPLPVAEARQIALDALDGLAHLHDGRTVHGDLKPGNLLVRQDGEIAIGDAGLTWCLASAAGPLEAARAPQFAPPELVGGEVPVERASDVWAMAATLHFMLTLEPPRDEYARQTPLEAARENPIVPLAARLRDVPSDLARCVDGALATDLHARPADARALRDQLTAPGPIGPVSPPKGRLLPMSLMVVLVGAIVSYAAWVVHDGKPAHSRHDAALTTDAGIIDADISGPAPLATISVAIDSVPPGAQVTLWSRGGKTGSGPTPVRWDLPPGTAVDRIVLSMAGFDSEERVIDLTRDVAITIKLRRTPTPTPTISFTVNSVPTGAFVVLRRGEQEIWQGTTPTKGASVPKGGRGTIFVSNPGFKPWRTDVDLTENINLSVPLESEP